jgi:hypothetical protein
MAKKPHARPGRYIFVKSNPRKHFPKGKWRLVYFSKGCYPKKWPKNSAGLPGDYFVHRCHSPKPGGPLGLPLCAANQCEWTPQDANNWIHPPDPKCPNGCECDEPEGSPSSLTIEAPNTYPTDCHQKNGFPPVGHK